MVQRTLRTRRADTSLTRKTPPMEPVQKKLCCETERARRYPVETTNHGGGEPTRHSVYDHIIVGKEGHASLKGLTLI